MNVMTRSRRGAYVCPPRAPSRTLYKHSSSEVAEAVGGLVVVIILVNVISMPVISILI